MNKRMTTKLTPSIADILGVNSPFIANNQGFDTIELIGRYDTVKTMAKKMGLTLQPMPNNHKLYEKLEEKTNADAKVRRMKSSFKPKVEVIKLPKVNAFDKYTQIVITRNIPTLFDVAKTRKVSKETYCLITFAGLHQPSKNISSEALKIMGKFLRRKTFKHHKSDIATDTQDHQPINKDGTKAFKERFVPFSNHGISLEKTSYYFKQIDHPNISKIIYYDKYLKQLEKQGEELISKDLKAWKRLEVTLTFDVTKPKSLNFTDYLNSMGFMDDLYFIHSILDAGNIKYKTDFLIYQINSLLDNRFMNNHESKRQFNSVESLERFKQSDFRRYTLPN